MLNWSSKFILYLLWSMTTVVGKVKAQVGVSGPYGSGKTILENSWNALWIGPGHSSGSKFGVYHFRKSFHLDEKAAHFIVKVSADNRYKLFVNGQLVSVGPARGDLAYWNYETVDLAAYLIKGENCIAALVWNQAELRPQAQITWQTGFILQGNSSQEAVINSGPSWQYIESQCYRPLTGVGYPTWYIADPGELYDMNKAAKGWMTADYTATGWSAASILDRGNLKGTVDASGWMLVPSSLPQMERTVQRIAFVHNVQGVSIPPGFPEKKAPVYIPRNSSVSFLLDQGHLTTAYLNLSMQGGAGAGISLTYAEAPFENLKKYGTRKGNRNVVEGKDFAGRRDSIITDGTEQQEYSTLYWRTFRYILVRIQTKESPLIINDLFGTFTGYPFARRARLNASNPEIRQILDIGWRTARLDALETYMDCPYYEQLQYIGDTRIQAMISYFNAGDDRLARNAMNQMEHSRIAEGLTSSRHPSYTPQYIPTFSLWYIGMLYDYWIYRNDTEFVQEKLTGERSILEFFSKYQDSNGSLRQVPYWTFVDWADGKGWIRGMPPKGKGGGSSILDLQLLLAYQMASKMENQLGRLGYAQLYTQKAAQLRSTIRKRYWDSKRGLYSDTEDKNSFSQHANALSILAGMDASQGTAQIGKKLLRDTSLTPCSIYFKYYLHQALVKSGLGNDYLNWLDIWRNNIALGLTTWAETSDLLNSRSDCHAWGASPNIEFFRVVLGIDSDSPGFTTVRIEPHLGNLNGPVSGAVPHPLGEIAVDYQPQPQGYLLKVSLPAAVTGKLVWNQKNYFLHGGENRITVNK